MRKHVTTFLLLIILSLVLVGCGLTEKNMITQEEKDEAVKAFLTELFCFNKDGRYDILVNAIDSVEDEQLIDVTDNGIQVVSESHQKAYERYYKSFADMATTRCIEGMQKDRLPFQYDKYVVQNNILVQIDNIQCEVSEEGIYTFSVSFKSDQENDVFHSPIKGQVTLEIVEEEVLIDTITIY